MKRIATYCFRAVCLLQLIFFFGSFVVQAGTVIQQDVFISSHLKFSTSEHHDSAVKSFYTLNQDNEEQFYEVDLDEEEEELDRKEFGLFDFYAAPQVVFALINQNFSNQLNQKFNYHNALAHTHKIYLSNAVFRL